PAAGRGAVPPGAAQRRQPGRLSRWRRRQDRPAGAGARGMTATSPDECPYTLLGPDGVPRASGTPGTLGGYRRSRIYGRLDCPAALRAIAQGGYVPNRVFFAD